MYIYIYTFIKLIFVFCVQGAIDESGNYITSDHNGVIRKGEFL